VFLNTPRLLKLNFATVSPDPRSDRADIASATHPAVESYLTDSEPDNPFLAELPSALGNDVIALSSDLHYLHVHTTNGKTMLLYNLRDAMAALGNRGRQVHRSHWIADAHVRRLRRRNSQLVCVMSNDLEIPVSRRRQKVVSDRFGKDTKLSPPSSGS
jgi:DNA-binding LytR/AlgR family response regulator